MEKKRANRLGRGLSSLMSQPVAVQVTPNVSDQSAIVESESKAASSVPEMSQDVSRETIRSEGQNEALIWLAPESIQPNPDQPRQHFHEGRLAELAESIKQCGMMQPLTVRPGAGDSYYLIAGERRWRAAQIIDLKRVPVLVKDVDEQTSAELALVENIQREDLNPIERAEAFERLIEVYQATHEQIAERVGMERSSISNFLRLLKLQPDCRQMVRDGHLSMGQARAIAGIHDPEQQKQIANKTVRENLSVRKVEQLVKMCNQEQVSADQPKAKASPVLLDLEKQLAEQLATRVQIKPGKKKNSGVLMIEYYDSSQFEALCERMNIQITSA